MATTGQVNTNTVYDSYFWVYWSQASQDIAANKTTIYWSCGVTCGHSFYSNAIKMSAVTINGVKVYAGGTYSNFSQGEHRIAYGYMDISHGEDGVKSFTISPFTGWLYANNNYSSDGKTFDLTRIPRKAEITSAPDFNDLDNPSISFENLGGFPMDVWLEPNPVGDHLCIRKNIPNTGAYTWVLSDSEKDELRAKCSGTSCPIRFGLYTYIDGVQHASYVDREFFMTENKATRPDVSLDIEPIDVPASSVSKGLYVQGKTRIRVSVNAEGKYGASIKSWSTTIDGTTYNMPSFTSGFLTKPGLLDIVVSVTDSRGFTNSTTKQINVIPYSVPWITSFTVERQEDGTTVLARLQGGVSPVENRNAAQFVVVLNGTAKTVYSTGYDVNNTVTFTDVPTDQTLIAIAEIVDRYTSSRKEATLPTVHVTMDFHHSGTGVAFGKVAEHENMLDVAWDIKYKGGIIGDFIVEQGTSGIWTYRKWHSGIAECWGATNEKTISVADPYGAAYYYPDVVSELFPDGLFAAAPTGVSVQNYATMGLIGCYIPSLTQHGIGFFVSSLTAGTFNLRFTIHAAGRWK